MANEATTGNTRRVRVRSVQEQGRRRLGRFFGPDWTEIDVTKEELDQLDADRMLAVELVYPGDENRIGRGRAQLRDQTDEEPSPDRIHPLGLNLGVPPTTVPDTSEKGRAERAAADAKARAATTTAVQNAGAIPVRVVGEPSSEPSAAPVTETPTSPTSPSEDVDTSARKPRR